jgi:hypothetical protein
LLRQRIILVPNTDFSRAILTSALGHLGEVDAAGALLITGPSHQHGSMGHDAQDRVRGHHVTIAGIREMRCHQLFAAPKL